MANMNLKPVTVPNLIFPSGESEILALINKNSAEIAAETEARKAEDICLKENATNSSEEIERLQYYGNKDIVPTSQDCFEWTIKNEKAVITKYVGDNTEVVIPYKYIDNNGNLYSVESIYGYMHYTWNDDGSLDGYGFCGAFDNCASITSIIIPNSVTSIGEYAFYECINLIHITIPDSVTSIGAYAFWNCSSLISVTIPDGVTIIESYIFYGCISLNKVNFPRNLIKIRDYSFQGCSSISDIDIPDTVEEIGAGAFNGTSIVNFTVPEKTTEIGNSFNDCTNISNVIIHDNVTYIMGNIFHASTNVTIICSQGSYAETYAKDNNIPYRYTEVEPEIGDLTELNTVEKSSIVNAINEVNDLKADKTDIGDLSDLKTLEQGSIVGAINELDSSMELIKTIKIEEDDVQYIDVLTSEEGIYLDEFICVISGLFSVAGRAVVAIRSNDGSNYWLHMAVTYSDSDITNSQYKTAYSYNKKISDGKFLSFRSASAVDGVRVGSEGNLIAQGIAATTSNVNGSLVAHSGSIIDNGVNNLQVFTPSDSVSTFAAGTIVWLYGKKVRVTE